MSDDGGPGQGYACPGRPLPVLAALAAHPTVPRAPCASTIPCPGGGQCSSVGPGVSAEGPLPSADITKAGNCSRAQNLRASYMRDRRMPELKPYAKTGIRHRFSFSRDGYCLPSRNPRSNATERIRAYPAMFSDAILSTARACLLSGSLIPSIAKARGIFDAGSQTTHTFQPKTWTFTFLAWRLALTSGRFSRVT